MKKTPLKRKTPLKAKSTFTSKPAVKQRETGLRRTNIRSVGISSRSEMRAEIQALLRAIVILRDGGCFLRRYSHKMNGGQYLRCGGHRKDGDFILQAEHLESRSNASSFSDSRLVVCICQRHHIYYKPQHSAEYNELAGLFIGSSRKKLWDAVRKDRSPHKVDLKLERLVLIGELKKLLNEPLSPYFQEYTENVVAEILKTYKNLWDLPRK